jgi:acetolactate synthase-1/3 small subunit
MTLELSDTTDRLNTFQDMMKAYQIHEVVRTGVIALQKGSGNI